MLVEAVALFEAARTEADVRDKTTLLEQAEAAFQRIIDRNPSAVRTVTESEAARSAYVSIVSQALVIAQTIIDEGGFEKNDNGVQVLAGIAEAQARSGDDTGARETFSNALAVARTISNGPRLLADIAEAQRRSGDRAGALESFAQAVVLAQARGKEREEFAREAGTNGSYREDYVNELAYIAEAQARSGDRTCAQESFSKAFAVLQTITSEWERIELLTHISEAQNRALLHIGEADGNVQAVVAARTITNEWRKAAILGPMWLNPFSRGSQNDDIEADKQILALMGVAAKQRAQTSDIMEALERMRADKWERVRVLGAIGEGQARAGNRTAANESLSQAHTVARGITHIGWFLTIGIFVAKLMISKILRYEGWEARTLAEICEVQAQSLVCLAGKEAESGGIPRLPAVEKTIRHDRGWRAGAITRILQSMVVGSKEFSHREGKAGAMADLSLAQIRAGDVAGAQETTTQALKLVRRIRNEGRRAWVLGRIAEGQAQAADLSGARNTTKHALALAQVMSNEKLWAGIFVVMVKARIEAGDLEQAVEIASTIDDQDMRDGALAEIARKQAETGDVAQALQIARTIDSEDVRDGVLAEIAKAQAQAGAVAQAFALAQTITQKEQKIRGLSAVAEELARLANTTDLGELAQPLAAKEQQVGRVAILATGLVAAWSTYGCTVEQALALVLNGLESSSYAMDYVTCLVDIAKLQAQAGDINGARKSFSRAFTAAQTLPEEDHNEGWSRRRALSDIAKEQAGAGDVEHALTLVRRITPQEDRVRPMIDIAKEQAEAGDYTGAQEILSQAQEIAQTITHKGYRNWVLADIAETQAATGGIAQAKKVARAITDEHSRNCGLASVAVAQAKAQARKGDRAGARESFSRAVAAAQVLPEMDDYRKSRYEVLADIAKEQARTGDVEQALAVAQEITFVIERDWVLADIAETQAAKGGVAQAQTVGRTITDEYSRNRVLITVAVAQAKAQARKGDRAGARERFSQAVAEAQALPERTRCDLVGDIAKTQAQMGDMAEALRVALTITDREYRDAVLADISNAQAKTADIEWAQKIARTITDKDSRTGVLVNIAVARAKSHAREGDRVNVRERFSQALTLAETISDRGDREGSLAYIARAQAETGDFAHAFALAQMIGNDRTKSFVLVAIAKEQLMNSGLHAR